MKESIQNMEPTHQNPSPPQETEETHHPSSHTSVEMQNLSSKAHHRDEETEGKNDKVQEIVKGDDAMANVNNNSNKPLGIGDGDSGRERLKRHRTEVAGSVWIPDIWGKEELLKDWIDCSAFEASLMPNRIMSARSALVEEGRRATTARLRIENRCS